MTDLPKAATPLSPEQLRVNIDAGQLEFGTTDELHAPTAPIGQARAIDAIELAVTSKHSDFNVFVQGTQGTGRHTIVRDLLTRHADERDAPDDWVYVNNFEMPHKPRALRLPRGTGLHLKKAMESLVDDLANDIPALLHPNSCSSGCTRVPNMNTVNIA